MANYDDVATRWRNRALGHTTKQQLSNPRMPTRGDSIFSYGSHFEMARLLRDEKAQPLMWLINGDTWGPTTSKHQATVRNVINRDPLHSKVIIPFSVLSEAGIDFDSVRFVDVTPDRHEEINVTSYELPDGAQWRDDVVTDEWEQWNYTTAAGDLWVEPINPYRPYGEPEGHEKWTEWYEANVARKKELGVERRLTKPAVTHIERRLYVGRSNWQTWKVEQLDDGRTRYSRSYTRHWLGESLITGIVPITRERKCRQCGGDPERYNSSRDVYDYGRQKYDTIRVCSRCHRSGRERFTVKRRAYFLSGFDMNETRPSYFFCELPPKVRPTTVAEAYETLKPEAVKLAESLGREVKRQGDIYGIPLNLTTRELTKAGGVRIRMPKLVEVGTNWRGPIMEWDAPLPRLLGTNHIGTETITMPDGTLYARGTMTHAPEGRRPDHKRVSLGKQWHLILKNLVPFS